MSRVISIAMRRPVPNAPIDLSVTLCFQGVSETGRSGGRIVLDTVLTTSILQRSEFACNPAKGKPAGTGG